MSFERTRPGRALAILAMAALVVTGLTVSPAAADHERYESNRGRHAERTHEDHYRGRGHGHGKHKAHHRHHHKRWAWYGAHDHRAHYRHDARHAAQSGYFCRPCREHFRSQRHFERHLVHHHHVPTRRLSHVIVFSALGWIFHG